MKWKIFVINIIIFVRIHQYTHSVIIVIYGMFYCIKYVLPIYYLIKFIC